MEREVSGWRGILGSLKKFFSQPVGGTKKTSVKPPVQNIRESSSRPKPQEAEMPSPHSTASTTSEVSSQPVVKSAAERSGQSSVQHVEHRSAQTPIQTIEQHYSQPSVQTKTQRPERATEVIAEDATKQLWGQTFRIADEGLDEKQVVSFVGSLLNRYRELEAEQENFISLGELYERAAIQADKMAESIRARARNEASAEAARIVAEASRRSQEMLAEAKKAAQEATTREVERILAAAYRKATLTQMEAKQQAQMFLIRGREAIERDFCHQVKEVYNQLLLSLQHLVNEGNQLEAEWRSGTIEICKRDTFELEGYEIPSSGLSKGIMEDIPAISEGSEAEAAPISEKAQQG